MFNPLKDLPISIKFILEESPVTLSIYDRQGELIKMLLDGNHALGPVPDISWDGRNDNGSVVASGTYIAHLKTSKTKLTKKIVVVK